MRVRRFRCGLRRAEIAYLRAFDFDRLMPCEDLETADLRLRARPWLLRKLKTANALRDLPMGALMPDGELRGSAGLGRRCAKQRRGRRYDVSCRWREEEVRLHRANGFRIGGECADGYVHQKVKGRPPIVPDWHMHQCSHAFSNVTLLWLWPELQEFARQALRYHPLTSAWIAGTQPEQFQLELFKTGTRGRDLEAIALLMGHGASATTPTAPETISEVPISLYRRFELPLCGRPCSQFSSRRSVQWNRVWSVTRRAGQAWDHSFIKPRCIVGSLTEEPLLPPCKRNGSGQAVCADVLRRDRTWGTLERCPKDKRPREHQPSEEKVRENYLP